MIFYAEPLWAEAMSLVAPLCHATRDADPVANFYFQNGGPVYFNVFIK